jgi:hypothetical protein
LVRTGLLSAPELGRLVLGVVIGGLEAAGVVLVLGRKGAKTSRRCRGRATAVRRRGCRRLLICLALLLDLQFFDALLQFSG